MLAATWLTSTVCLVELGSDGIKSRVVFVADTLPMKDDQSILPGLSSLKCDVIVLCGSVLPRPFVNRGFRLVASEPVSQLLALQGVDGVEKCQVQERVPVREGIILIPYRSGGQLGACDWVLNVNQTNLLTFCGAKGINAPLAPLSKFVLFAREPVVRQPVETIAMPYGIDCALVAIPDSLVSTCLPMLKDVPRLSFDALPIWCHKKTRMIYERHEPSWGRMIPGCKFYLSNSETCIPIVVMDSELELLKNVAKGKPILQGLAEKYENVYMWSVEEASRALTAIGPNTILLGPRWTNQPGIAHKFKLSPCVVNKTEILQGKMFADKCVEAIGLALGLDLENAEVLSKLRLKGLRLYLCENSSDRDFYVDLLGTKHFRILCSDSGMNQKLIETFQTIDQITIKHPGIVSRLLLVSDHTRKDIQVSINVTTANEQPSKPLVNGNHVVPVANEQVSVENKTNVETLAAENPSHTAVVVAAVDESKAKNDDEKEPKRLKLSESPDDNHGNVESSNNQPKSTTNVAIVLDPLCEILKTKLKENGGRLSLSDLAKLGTFGDKMKTMELVRKHPGSFDVLTDAGKRVIVLKN